MKSKILFLVFVLTVSANCFAISSKKLYNHNLLKVMSKKNIVVETDDQTKMQFKFKKGKDLTVNYELSTGSIWSQIILDLKKPLQDLKAIKITYKAEKAVYMKLFQKTLGYEGNQFYQYYQKTLEPTSEYVTLTLPIDEFNYPTWVLDKLSAGDEQFKSLALPLDLTEVTGLHFSPIPNKTNFDSSFSIENIEFLNN